MKNFWLIVVGSFLTSGCYTASWEEQKLQKTRAAEAKRVQQAANVTSMRKRVRQFEGRLSTFRCDTRRELEASCFNYVRSLGGTVISRGKAEYEIEINTDREYVGKNAYGDSINDLVVNARLTDLSGVGGNQVLMAVGKSRWRCRNRSCESVAPSAATDALKSMK